MASVMIRKEAGIEQKTNPHHHLLWSLKYCLIVFVSRHPLFFVCIMKGANAVGKDFKYLQLLGSMQLWGKKNHATISVLCIRLFSAVNKLTCKCLFLINLGEADKIFDKK